MRDILEQWFAEMAKTDEGCLAVSNLLHDYHCKRVATSTIAGFLAQVATEWANALAGRSPAALIPLIARAEPEKFLCQGNKPFSMTTACSRVVPAKDLIRDNIRYERLGWVSSPDYVPEETLEELELGWDDCGAQPYGTMPAGASRFAWVTRSDVLDSLVSDGARDARYRASAARDALGLAHLVSPIQLVIVEYPPDRFRSDDLHPPTFLDGSPYVVFRCGTHASYATWGRTLNLEGGPELPEAVHTPMPFDRAFRIRSLGYTRRLNWAFDYGAVWQQAPYPYSQAAVTAMLDDMLP